MLCCGVQCMLQLMEDTVVVRCREVDAKLVEVAQLILSPLNSKYVIVRPLSTVGYTSVVASVIHSRQWSN